MDAAYVMHNQEFSRRKIMFHLCGKQLRRDPEGSGGRHGLAVGDKGLESGALKIAKQTLRRRMRRAVWIGDFGTDTGAFWFQRVLDVFLCSTFRNHFWEND